MAVAKQEAQIRPNWAGEQTQIPPRINFGNEIDGPFEMQLDSDRRIYYHRSYIYDSRDSRSHKQGGQEDPIHETLALEHWVHEPGKALGYSEILKLSYSYMPDGSINKQITIHQIERQYGATFNYAWYDDNGTLHRDGMYMGLGDRQSHARAKTAGHFEKDELPEQIDFNATAQAFIEQINRLGVGAEFQKPLLIPAAS